MNDRTEERSIVRLLVTAETILTLPNGGTITGAEMEAARAVAEACVTRIDETDDCPVCHGGGFSHSQGCPVAAWERLQDKKGAA